MDSLNPKTAEPCITLHVLYSEMHEAIWRFYWKQKRSTEGCSKFMSGDKTSSGEIGLDIRTHASPKVGQDQVSGGVSVLCWHAAPVAYVLWKPCTIK